MDKDEFLSKLKLMRITNDLHRIWFANELKQLSWREQRELGKLMPNNWHLLMEIQREQYPIEIPPNAR